jgi:hypothetical protein
VARSPLHDADHHGDLIVVIDADLGVSIAGGAEGTQICEVLRKLGQGRTIDKSPLVLACIFVLRSHGHHLRGSDYARDRARLTASAPHSLAVYRSMHPAAAHGQGQRARTHGLS